MEKPCHPEHSKMPPGVWISEMSHMFRGVCDSKRPWNRIPKACAPLAAERLEWSSIMAQARGLGPSRHAARLWMLVLGMHGRLVISSGFSEIFRQLKGWIPHGYDLLTACCHVCNVCGL